MKGQIEKGLGDICVQDPVINSYVVGKAKERVPGSRDWVTMILLN